MSSEENSGEEIRRQMAACDIHIHYDLEQAEAQLHEEELAAEAEARFLQAGGWAAGPQGDAKSRW